MNEQDRLTEIALSRRNVDERDIDAIRRKMLEFYDAANMCVLHGLPPI